jgi:carboxynorspermidine decarboxylase
MIMRTQLTKLESPRYVISEEKIQHNLELFKYIKDRTRCKILLATKAYSCFSTYPLISAVLDGTANSSLHECRLSHETFGKQTHIYSPAYCESSFNEITTYANCIVFNSVSQLTKFSKNVAKTIDLGIRLNPEHVEVDNKLYSPCVPGSRFGVLVQDLSLNDCKVISGFHIHALCQNTDESLIRLMDATEQKFKEYLELEHIKWVNFGGGHLIPSKNYNKDRLIDAINEFQNKYNVTIILEPGEAVVLNAGVLVAKVLDIVHNKMDIAILNTSATAHMPDVLEMPYRPDVINGFDANIKKYTYRLGGNTCLSGDIIGEYSFEKPLQIGDELIFKDTAQYTMVKNTTFNGICLPSIYIKKQDSRIIKLKSFGYDDFKQRLS